MSARWILGDEIGRGALGRVVRVRRVDDDAAGADDGDGGGEVLAGKILHRSHRADPRAVARLEAEARLLAEVHHPDLVGVHGLVEIDGERVLLMDLVDGPSLADVIARDAPLPVERAVALTRGIAAGLVEAHRAGLVHRDLKPANVLVTRDGDVPRIVDFGLARATALTGVDAGDLMVVGTPAYMAPESLDPMAVDSRSDLYALGCILFELLTGRPPYDGATSVAVLEQHREAPIPELPDAPADLARLVRWLLAKSPADRPQSAAAVERALADRTALVAHDPAAPGNACTRCGARVIREVPVCFACRAEQVAVEPGDHTVFVTGPGQITHKLDATLRARILDWLRASPALGLSPGRLEKEVPRVPFVLVAGVHPDSARGLVEGLGRLGLQAEARRGGRYALPGIKQKGKTMAGRYGTIALVSTAGMWHALSVVMVPLMAAVGGFALVRGYTSASKPACEARPLAAAGLPPALAEALGRVAPVVRTLEEARHRDALRGVVERALALRAAVPADEAARIAPDLARVIDVATVAASKLDELERGVDAASLHAGDAAVRARLRERTWAARLLEVTARLDALRARWAAARADVAGGAAGAGSTIDELRDQLDALESLERELAGRPA
ncbi:MAG: serine/threonine protein kinase [Kofleriaceae bacterium]|nr:serine/threonine protein kinase [Kofleriaceae bacterium]